MPAPWPSCRLCRGAIEAHTHLTYLDLIAVPERPQAFDTLPVQPCAVGAAAVLDVPGAPAEREQRVLGRDERVIDDDRVVHVAPHRIDSVERYRGARLGSSLRRGHDDEARQRPTCT